MSSISLPSRSSSSHCTLALLRPLSTHCQHLWTRSRWSTPSHDTTTRQSGWRTCSSRSPTRWSRIARQLSRKARMWTSCGTRMSSLLRSWFLCWTRACHFIMLTRSSITLRRRSWGRCQRESSSTSHRIRSSGNLIYSDAESTSWWICSPQCSSSRHSASTISKAWNIWSASSMIW